MAQVVDITALLQAAQSADAGARQQAEAGLRQLESQSESYLLSLSAHLSDEGKSVDTRRMAGLVLKNTLDARDDAKKAALARQWIALSESVKQQIKTGLLSTLGSQVGEVRSTAALAVAKVAAIEIPSKTWPVLIPTLLNNAQATSPAGLRHATLVTLGFVCEELGNLEEDYLEQEQINAILTAVVAGMRPDEQDTELRLAATTALNNALEFSVSNFSNEAERNYIMQMICHGTQGPSEKVKQAAWECLVGISGIYYEHLPAYMGELFKLSQQAMRDKEDGVVLQALEFWSTIAEQETSRGHHEDGEVNSETVNHNILRTALPQLVPMLLEQLTKQEESGDDDGAWNPALSAGTALGLTAMAVGDPIVELVMPYVTENIQQTGLPESWRQREAATFAFGTILEGPSVGTLGQLSRSGMGFLMTALKDPHPQVRNTTAWTLGRIFEFVAAAEGLTPPLLGPQNLPPVVAALLEAMRDESHIAEKVCYAVSALAEGFRGVSPSPLSTYFKDIVGALLDTAGRHTGDPQAAARLQIQAFEAVNEVVRASSIDVAPLVAQLIPVAVGKLAEATSAPPVPGEASETAAELQGLLCGVIQVAMQKLGDGGEATQSLALTVADSVMEALLRVAAWRQGSVNEEALLAVTAMAYICDRGFAKYMDAFFPILERGLQAYADWQTCSVSVQVVSDICSAIGETVYPYCDRTMTVLLQNLQNDEVRRSIKPQILSAFGDIALAIGDRFEIYLGHVLQMLQSAMHLCVDLAAQAGVDEEKADYANALRQGILDAWTGMYNGFSKEKVDQYLKQYAPGLLDFIENVACDQENMSEGVWRTAAALIGDVASHISGVGVLFQQKQFAKQFLTQCSREPSMSEAARNSIHLVAAAEAAGPNFVSPAPGWMHGAAP